MSDKESKLDAVIQLGEHIKLVRKNVDIFTDILKEKVRLHDKSKTEGIEKEWLLDNTKYLKGLTYMSKEYKKRLVNNPAIQHHYQVNPHHPEFHNNGIDDMSLFDMLEMLMDWKAAVKKHADGNIYESLIRNKERFNISDQLYNIFKNTIDEMATYVIKIKKLNNGKVITLCADSQPEMLRKIYNEKLPKILEDKLISKLFMNTTSTTIDRIEESGYFIDFIILGSIVRE